MGGKIGLKQLSVTQQSMHRINIHKIGRFGFWFCNLNLLNSSDSLFW